MTTNLTVGRRGEIALPIDVRERHGLMPETPIRIVETRSGILLVPLAGGPMEPALQEELAEWQEGATSAWESFPYDEGQP